MKPAQLPLAFRPVFGLAALGAVLLSAPSAFAQTTPSPFYSFQVTNATLSGGDPLYSITNALTFSDLQIKEVFADNFMQTIQIPSLSTDPVTGLQEQTGAFVLDTSTPGTLSDPIHGALTSAVLTGSLGSGPTQIVTVETTIGGPVTTQKISSDFSASLFGPSATALGLGQFSLLDSGSNVVQPFTVVIGASPVPEASTVVSTGLLLALGLGGFVMTRRRTASAK